MAVTIRPTRDGDAAALYEYWVVLRKHNAATDPRITLAEVSASEFAVAVAEVAKRPTSAAFIAEERGRMVGFVSGGLETNQPDRLPERFATVGYLYVDPGSRRQGIARRLVAAMSDWARVEHDVTHMEMSVLAADVSAAAFWRSVGFSPFIERLWMPLRSGGD
jgi:GNAT superfamily N-acetyltransferase